MTQPAADVKGAPYAVCKRVAFAGTGTSSLAT
jgi:hypothetical protein